MPHINIYSYRFSSMGLNLDTITLKLKCEREEFVSGSGKYHTYSSSGVVQELVTAVFIY